MLRRSVCALSLQLAAAAAFPVEGDQAAWSSIFASTTPEKLAGGARDEDEIQGPLPWHRWDFLKWTEGPIFVRDGQGPSVIFSDTIASRLYQYREGDRKPMVIREFSGTNERRPKDGVDRLEPGSNGLAVALRRQDGTTRDIFVCQHGSRRIVKLNVVTEVVSQVMATHAPNGRQLNGPNDLAYHDGQLYFTDPPYAFLDGSGKGEDLPYLDELMRTNGTGGSAVYQVGVERGSKVELISTELTRPNGIAVVPGEQPADMRLIVSDCCQGKHNAKCRQGISRWVVKRKAGTAGDWQTVSTIEDVCPAEFQACDGGCADGFAYHGPTGLLVASCSGGVCIVDLDKQKVLARLLTATEFRVSNVLLAPDGYAYLTGQGGFWRLKLAAGTPIEELPAQVQEPKRSEL
eukprot:TRINITY_DN42402_c0_g1_i1.p1 TRINITY_DN42402_c0_g1~~TRINITY_DN42402_c0_g1_i1.p1  ORF type:complete len:404 (+),score=74.70 TRINITY_DN42402_c0_g1_i1:163-1374(+)